MKKIRRRYSNGHHRRGKKLSAEHKRKISEANKGKKHTTETKNKMSKAQKGRKHTAETKEKMSLAWRHRVVSAETKEKISKTLQGYKHTAETKLNMSLASMKYDPDNPYCDVWKDKEYVKDIRKDYCENADCKKISNKLQNHHIHLDKKRCAPIDIMTMCVSCHMALHLLLLCRKNGKPTASPKDYIIINRPDHVSYIHKKTHKIIKIKRKQESEEMFKKAKIPLTFVEDVIQTY